MPSSAPLVSVLRWKLPQFTEFVDGNYFKPASWSVLQLFQSYGLLCYRPATMLVNPATFRLQSPTGFIVLEGINGAGKSTLLKGLQSALDLEGKLVQVTREPGATPLGKLLRKLLLEDPCPRSPRSELFLFAADRTEHIAAVIEPALTQGSVVLCDRYYYSTVAFQGYGRQLDLEEVLDVNRLAVRDRLPDVVLLLDMPVEEALNRAAKRGAAQGKDAFEQEAVTFHNRVRRGFLELAETLPEPFIVLDAQLPPAELLAHATRALCSVYGNLLFASSESSHGA